MNNVDTYFICGFYLKEKAFIEFLKSLFFTEDFEVL